MAEKTVCFENRFSCQEIKGLRLQHFLGNGKNKISFLTFIDSHPIAIRFATPYVRDISNLKQPPFDLQTDVFKNEWSHAQNTTYCHEQLIRTLGTCSDSTATVDVVELLAPYDLVEAKIFATHNRTLPSLWCWPVKWLMDIVNQIVFFEERSLVIKGHVFYKEGEFGLSLISGTLKQPDVEKLGVRDFNDAWRRTSLCRAHNLHLPHCILMGHTEEWALRSCKELSSPHPYCNLTSFPGMSHLIFTYIMKSLGQRLLQLPAIHAHPIYDLMTTFLFHENYFDFPTPLRTQTRLNSLWKVFDGDGCIAQTTDWLMKEMFGVMTKNEIAQYGDAQFGELLRKMEGMTLNEVIQKGMMDKN